jgi:hypothetical protein
MVSCGDLEGAMLELRAGTNDAASVAMAPGRLIYLHLDNGNS